MTWRTSFSNLFELEAPIALAPMAAVAGGRLAAAVSNAGGLGLIGGGYGDEAWLEDQFTIVAKQTSRQWGVGLITWSLRRAVLDLVLAHQPAAVLLAFGDPTRHASTITDAGAKLICQVQDLDQARRAADAGADVIVAQGTEAGGHGARRSTLPLVPAVVDAVSPTPVLAAGGVADGRGVAAALMLGAAGVLVGTRFYATPEALGLQRVKDELIRAGGTDTIRTKVFDAARGLDWPQGYTGRALQNAFVRRWQGHERQLHADTGERDRLLAAVRDGDTETAMVWAGEDIDLITSLEPAAQVVRRLSDEAEQLLRSATEHLSL